MPIAGTVAILGTGVTPFGELFDRTYSDLVLEAAFDALRDAEVEAKDISGGWLGTYMPYSWGYEGNSGSSLGDPLGLLPVPVSRVENYCASGMDAVRHAAMAVAAGECEYALAVGAEKMREVAGRESLIAVHAERGHPLVCKGRTPPGMFALLAQRYLARYGAPREALAEVAVKNHYHGSLNPKAHFRKSVTVEQVLRAPVVAEPLGLLDCCPTTDGAAAVVVTSVENARKRRAPYVVIRGIGLAHAGGYFSMQFDPQFDFLSFEATREAARQAYKQAGVKKPGREIQVVECHDCFTITEILNYEDLGLAERGEGWRLVREGRTKLGGPVPVNTSGGLKSCGHPIGATGVRMICEIADQLRGRAKERQVPGARLGLAHTLGGPGVVAAVTVLESGQ